MHQKIETPIRVSMKHSRFYYAFELRTCYHSIYIVHCAFDDFNSIYKLNELDLQSLQNFSKVCRYRSSTDVRFHIQCF